MKKLLTRNEMRVRFMNAFELPEQKKIWKWIETNMLQLEGQCFEAGYRAACKDCKEYSYCDDCKDYLK